MVGCVIYNQNGGESVNGDYSTLCAGGGHAMNRCRLESSPASLIHVSAAFHTAASAVGG